MSGGDGPKHEPIPSLPLTEWEGVLSGSMDQVVRGPDAASAPDAWPGESEYPGPRPGIPQDPKEVLAVTDGISTLRNDITEERLKQLEERMNRMERWKIEEEHKADSGHPGHESPVTKEPGDEGDEGRLHQEEDDSDDGLEGFSRATFEEENGYEFAESIWDLGFFVGLPGIGTVGSVFILFVTSVNAAMQIMFCFVISDNLTSQVISKSTVEDMRMWRAFEGNTLEHAHHVTHRSLTSRLCAADGSVSLSSGVAGVLESIHQYMPKEDGLDPWAGMVFMPYEGIGRATCCLVIVIWLLNVGIEFHTVKDCLVSILMVPRGRKGTTRIMCDATCGVRQIVRLSNGRKVYCLFILYMKSIVAIFLAVFGTVFLCHTIRVGDLLLNAAALQIVLDLDTLFYENLRPNHAAKYLKSMKPLAPRKTRHCRGLDKRAVASAILIPSAVLIANFTILAPQADTLRDALKEICGGNVDILVATDEAGVVIATGSPIRNAKDTYEYNAILQALWDGGSEYDFGNEYEDGKYRSMTAMSAGINGGHWSLKEVTQANPTMAVGKWNIDCKDLIGFSANADRKDTFSQILAAELPGGTVIKQCSEVLKYCSWDTTRGVRVRQFCPATCGCDNPLPLVATGGKDNGCPSSCLTSRRFKAAIDSATCADQPYGGPFWTNYVSSLQGFQASYPAAWQLKVDIIIADVIAYGCQFANKSVSMKTNLAPVYWSDPCFDENFWFLTPVMHACPKSCGCDAVDSHAVDGSGPDSGYWRCPSKCLQRRLEATATAAAATR